MCVKFGELLLTVNLGDAVKGLYWEGGGAAPRVALDDALPILARLVEEDVGISGSGRTAFSVSWFVSRALYRSIHALAITLAE